MTQGPLAAITSEDGEVKFYWCESDGNTDPRTCTVSWSSSSTITALGSGYGFSAAETNDGGEIGLYYRDFSGVLRSLRSSDDGSIWSTGLLEVN